MGRNKHCLVPEISPWLLLGNVWHYSSVAAVLTLRRAWIQASTAPLQLSTSNTTTNTTTNTSTTTNTTTSSPKHAHERADRLDVLTQNGRRNIVDGSSRSSQNVAALGAGVGSWTLLVDSANCL